MNKPMENISIAGKALELVEEFINKMGGSIVNVGEIFTNFNQNTTTAKVEIYFNPDQLREYISQSL
jgi:conjugal transfer/entry exclusion protein